MDDISSVEAVVCSIEAACSDMLDATSSAKTVISAVTVFNTAALELRFEIERVMRRRTYFSAIQA